MCSKSFVSVIILYLCMNNTNQYRFDEEESKDISWDFIVLSQHWPITICMPWKEHGPKHHCTFPDKNDRWTLHGIWPTKSGTKGPQNCNNSWSFDHKQIKPIEKELDQVWTNIFKETPHYSLWEHEWRSHGTCGATIEPLNTQLKYFSKGIEWNKQYPISEILKAANILPSNTRKLTAEELGKAVISKTGKQPTVACLTSNGIQYLGELRICIDKKFNVIDCETMVHKSCDVSNGIIYPETP